MSKIDEYLAYEDAVKRAEHFRHLMDTLSIKFEFHLSLDSYNKTVETPEELRQQLISVCRQSVKEMVQEAISEMKDNLSTFAMNAEDEYGNLLRCSRHTKSPSEWFRIFRKK